MARLRLTARGLTGQSATRHTPLLTYRTTGSRRSPSTEFINKLLSLLIYLFNFAELDGKPLAELSYFQISLPDGDSGLSLKTCQHPQALPNLSGYLSKGRELQGQTTWWKKNRGFGLLPAFLCPLSLASDFLSIKIGRISSTLFSLGAMGRENIKQALRMIDEQRWWGNNSISFSSAQKVSTDIVC